MQWRDQVGQRDRRERCLARARDAVAILFLVVFWQPARSIGNPDRSSVVTVSFLKPVRDLSMLREPRHSAGLRHRQRRTGFEAIGGWPKFARWTLQQPSVRHRTRLFHPETNRGFQIFDDFLKSVVLMGLSQISLGFETAGYSLKHKSTLPAPSGDGLMRIRLVTSTYHALYRHAPDSGSTHSESWPGAAWRTSQLRTSPFSSYGARYDFAFWP